MPFAYVVINQPQRGVSLSAIAGVYSSLFRTPSLKFTESPLPLIVQCSVGEMLDLEPLTQIIEEMDSDVVLSPEDFVKAVISEVVDREVSIFPHVPLFYGVVSSSVIKKYIAMDFSALKELEQNDSSLVYQVFDNFVDAFIYVLAGGNTNLSKWGLQQYMGSQPAEMDAVPRATSNGKDEGVAVPQVSVIYADPDFIARAGRPEPSDSNDGEQHLAPKPLSQTPPAWRKELNPSHIVPPDYLDELADYSVPFIVHREQLKTIYTHEEAEVERLNLPLRLPHDDLPPLVIFYLRSHGWDDHVIKVVTVAYLCQATLKGFLKALSREHVPLAEASFVWHALQHLATI